MAAPAFAPSPAYPVAPLAASTVRVRGFSRSFGAAKVLEGLDLDIAPGEFVALLGRSGSGKTTLLRALAGLDRVDSKVVATPARKAVVYQEPRLFPWKRVLANVAINLPGADAQARAAAALGEVGLSHRTDAWPATLSGGEAQRAALARALVREPELLLLDEPFAALDALTRVRMHDLVLELVSRHRPAVLLVTHDVDEAILLADRILVLSEGRIAAEELVYGTRPRRRDAAFADLRERLLAHLGVHVPPPQAAELAPFAPARAPVYAEAAE